MRRALVTLVLAGLVTAAVVAVGTLARGGPGHDSATPFRTTPLSEFDPASVVISRAPFCSAIDPRQVQAALGGSPSSSRSWANGDRVALAEGAGDVAHEFGCEYVGADGSTARAWVFAPPVGAAQAARLVTGAGKAKGCTPVDGSPFGSPSVGLTCSASDGSERASYRGLFGDAWLHCELSVPSASLDDEELRDRAGRWCVGVAKAAGADSSA